MPYESGEKVQPITIHGEHADDVGGTGVVWETCSHSTLATQTSRPVIGSEWIQHQGQPRDRTLMAHGKGSTGNSSDVPDMGKMAASPQTAQVTASSMNTSREIKVYDGDAIIQSLELRQGGSGGIGGVG